MQWDESDLPWAPECAAARLMSPFSVANWRSAANPRVSRVSSANPRVRELTYKYARSRAGDRVFATVS